MPDLIEALRSSGVDRAESRADLADKERAVNVLRPVALPSEGFSICRAVADKLDDDRFKVSVVPVSMSGVDVQKAGSSSRRPMLYPPQEQVGVTGRGRGSHHLL